MNTELFKTLTPHQRFFISVLKNTSDSSGWSDLRQKDICSNFGFNEITVKVIIKALKDINAIKIDQYISNSHVCSKYKILDNEFNDFDCPIIFDDNFMKGGDYDIAEKGFIVSLFDLLEKVEGLSDTYEINLSKNKISKATGLSNPTVSKYLSLLESKGTIKKLDKGFGYWVCI